ncbi:MAG: Flp1 family type IVb pilin [Blautia obeum]
MIEPVFMRATREGVKIMVVLISLVIIFKEQLTNLVQAILSKITKQSNSI